MNICKEFEWSHHIMGDTMPQPDIWQKEVKSLVSGLGYILISRWPKNIQDITRAIGCFSQRERKLLLLKAKLTYVMSSNMKKSR